MRHNLHCGLYSCQMQEWPEDIYPPYANGPGYVISGGIAKFVVSQHANQSLRVSLIDVLRTAF